MGEGRDELAPPRSQWQATEDNAEDMAAAVGEFADVSVGSVTRVGAQAPEQLAY